MLIQTIIGVIVAIYSLVLPGFLLYNILDKKKNSLLIYQVLSFIIVPFIVYYFILISGSLMKIWSILISTTLINIILGYFCYGKKLRFPKLKIDKSLLIIIIVIFLFSFIIFSYDNSDRFSCADYWMEKNIDSENTITRCNLNITVLELNGVSYLKKTNEPIKTFTDAEHIGGGKDQYCLYNNTGNILDNYLSGELSTDEPYGIMIHPSFFIVLFNEMGLRVLFSVINILVVIMTFKIGKNIIKNRIILLFSTILPFTLYLFYNGYGNYNQNHFGLLVLLLMIYFMTKKIRTTNMIIAGILYGVLGSARTITLIFAPIIAYYIIKNNKNWKKHLMIFGFSCFIVITPVLFLNNILYDNPLQHPGFINLDLQEYSILGIDFKSHATLNFPFNDEIVRSLGIPYPTFILVPLTIISNLGIILSGIFIFGIISKSNNKPLYFMKLLTLILISFLMINENWTENNITYLILVIPFISLIIFSTIDTNIKKTSIKSIILILILITVCAFSIKATYNLDFPIDDRHESVHIKENDYSQKHKNELNRIQLLPNIIKIFKENNFKYKIMNTKTIAYESKHRKEKPDSFHISGNCYPASSLFIDFKILNNSVNRFLSFPRHQLFDENILENNGDTKKEIDFFKDKKLDDIMIANSCNTFDLRIEYNQKHKFLTFIVDDISNKEPKQIIEPIVKLTFFPRNISFGTEVVLS